jgi:hypothetical protein
MPFARCSTITVHRQHRPISNPRIQLCVLSRSLIAGQSFRPAAALAGAAVAQSLHVELMLLQRGLETDDLIVRDPGAPGITLGNCAGDQLIGFAHFGFAGLRRD